jgi:hypothetical protein
MPSVPARLESPLFDLLAPSVLARRPRPELLVPSVPAQLAWLCEPLACGPRADEPTNARRPGKRLWTDPAQERRYARAPHRPSPAIPYY